MAKNRFANLSEENFCTPMIVGQANDPAKQTSAIHPTDGGIYKMECAIEGGNLVGIKTDGKVYLASAEAGVGQIRALGVNFQQAVNGQAIDIVDERTLFLDALPPGHSIGGTAYLSDVTPGSFTGTKPVGSGKLVQVVGVFVDPGSMAVAAVKVDVELTVTVL